MSGNGFLKRHARELPPATALLIVLLAVLVVASFPSRSE